MIFSQYRKISYGIPSIFREVLLSKIFMAGGGISRLSLETSLSHSRKNSWGALFFRKFLDWINCIRSCTAILSKNDFLTVPKYFARDSLSFQKILLSKIFMAGRGISRLSLETFLSHSTEKNSRGTLLFQKISGSKNLHKMMYHDFVEWCFPHSTENFSKGTLCLPENFWYRKFWRIRGGYHYLPSKFFCLTMPENFVKEQFCVSENFWYRKILCRRGGSRFCLGNFLSHSTKKFCRGHFCFRMFLD